LLLVPENPKAGVLIVELIEAAAAAALPKFRGIMVLGSNGNWLYNTAAVEGASVLAAVPLADAKGAELAATEGTGD
jgi:hypothetical protein